MEKIVENFKIEKMKILVLVSLCSLLCKCNGQIIEKRENVTNSTKKMEKINKKLDVDVIKSKGNVLYQVETLTDSQPINEYQYFIQDNTKSVLIEGNESSGFIEKINYKMSSDVEYNNYSGKGDLINYSLQSIYGFKKEEKEYNSEGHLISYINYEKEFNFKWIEVQKYLQSLEVQTDIESLKKIVNFHIGRIFMNKLDDSLKNEIPLIVEKIWIIEGVEAIYKNNKGIFYIYLDGDTGEELLVKQFLGKKSGDDGAGTYADFKVIYSKKEKQKSSSTSYLTYNSKTYTEEEWKAFEQEQWEKYQANRNKKSFWDKLFG